MSLPNGGPPIVDDVHMTWVPWYIKQWLDGVRGMKWHEIGAYMQVLATLYDRMGDLPDDDRYVSIALGVDIRSWRTMKKRLIELGKIDIVAGRIHNKKVEDEITAYCRKVKNKREAAEKREAEKREESARLEAEKREAEKRRVAEAAQADRRRSVQSFPGVSPEFPANLQQGMPKIDGDLSKNINDFNVTTTTGPTTTVAQHNHSCALDIDSEREEEKSQHQPPPESRAARSRRTAEAAKVLSDRLLTITNGAMASAASAAGLLNLSPIMAWLESGADPETDIVPAVMAVAQTAKNRGTQKIRSWDYFNNAIAEAKARRERGLPAVTIAATRDGKHEAEMRAIAGIVGRRAP